MSMTTWATELIEAMAAVNDPGPVVQYAPDETTFSERFHSGYGGTEGAPVLAWTEQRVYFPVCYDGSEWLASAPRGFQSEGQEHVGGG